ncbi:MAG: tyrosine-type recombinase/integrase [Acidobacteria bacterium]|nr:tyrosine-type recombinase/integrase [Acidobacteriota bacterium]
MLPKKPRATKRRGRHPEKALTDAFCRNVAQAGRYSDGNGLYLHVDPSGARRWVQRLVVQGRSRALGLGSYRLVSLAEARATALANRKLAGEGGDPTSLGRRRSPGVPTFEEAAVRVVDIYSGAWRQGSKTAGQWRATLRDYIFPHLGDMSVDRVTSADIMAALQPIWTGKHVTARKVHHRVSTVMRWAIAQGYRADNPAGDAITAALPRRPVPVQHRRALPHGEVAAAMHAVRAADAWTGTKLAFELLVLTATRSAEVRLARWSEVDLVARLWTIPASRMKAKREHRVPLSGRAAEILGEAERLRPSPAPHELVFTSVRGKLIDGSAISKRVGRPGLAGVPHGFRSSFRDWASERTSYPREVVEAALAHAVRDQTEAAYARSDLFERRRHLMDDWTEYLAETRGQVLSLKR